MKKLTLKIIAFVLTLTIILQICPISFGIVRDSTERTAKIETESMVDLSRSNTVLVKGEVASARNEYSKTFLLEDGTYYMVCSSIPIHEFKNGLWQEINSFHIKSGDTIKSMEQSINSVTTALAAESNLLDSVHQVRAENVNSERMIVNGGQVSFYQRYINNTNTQNKIYKYLSLWVMPYNLSNTFEGFQVSTISAKVNINCQFASSGSVKIYAYEALSDWDTSINYSLSLNSFNTNPPASNADLKVQNKVLDANIINQTSVYSWDVTDTYCKWEKGIDENNGIVFTSKNNSKAVYVGGCTFSRRFRIIDETDTNFDYKTVNMGRAGNISVNEFTNTIKITRDEIGVYDELLPVSISRIIDLGKTYDMPNPSGFGSRWNYESNLGQLSTSNIYWKSPSGETVYFSRSQANEMENGLQKWISDNNCYEMWVDAVSLLDDEYDNDFIVDDEGNKYEFDEFGRMISIIDSHSTTANPIKTNIIYNGTYLSKIIDSSGRCFKFNMGTYGNMQCVSNITVYEEDGENENIVEMGGEDLCISYTYTSVLGTGFFALASAIYPDNKVVSYTYDANTGRLLTATDIDGSILYVTYNGNNNSVSEMLKKSDNSSSASNLERIQIDSHNTYQRVITTNERTTEIVGYNHLLDVNYRKDSNGNEFYMQYDESGVPVSILIGENTVNLLTDPGFEAENEEAWSSYNGEYLIDDNSIFSSTHSAKLIHDPNDECGISQIINVNALDGETFAIGGYGYAESIIPLDSHFFGFMIFECDEDGEFIDDPLFTINFDNAIINEPQYILGGFALDHDIDYFNVVLVCSDQTSDVFFDDIVFYKVSDSNYIDISEEQDDQSGCGCSNCENGNCICECENNGNLNCVCCNTQSINVRNAFGNLIKSGVSIDGKEYTYTNNFSSNGHYLTKTIDVNGVETNYIFNSENGTLETISKGTDEAINYSYNAMGMLTSISQAISALSNTNAVVQYSYNDDKLETITHNGITYSFIYDEYGNCSCEQVKNTTQNVISEVNYTYFNDYDISKVNTVTYGNGDSIRYSYTGDKVTAIYLDGSSQPRYTYSYDTNGNLTSYTDIELGLTTTYSTSNEYEITNSNNDVLYSVSFNNDGQLVEEIFGTTYLSGDNEIPAYGEHSYNCSTGKTNYQTTISGPIEDKSFKTSITNDALGRIDSKEYISKTEYFDPFMTFKLDYQYDDAPTKATNQVSNITTTHYYSPGSGHLYYGISDDYSYDNNGRITDIERTRQLQLESNLQYSQNTTYEYDSIGQLIRENNEELYNTFVYHYGPYGNITSVETYPYTTSSTLGSPIRTDTYTYDSNYRDLLSTFNSKSLTYDDAGNPTFLGADCEFKWQGKRLESYKYLYTYDDNLGDINKYQEQIFEYDANGNIIKKISNFIRQNDDTVLNNTTYYIWDNDRLIGQQIINSNGSVGTTIRYLYNSNNEAYGLILNDEELYYYVKDQTGNVIEIYTENGCKSVVQYKYDAWGNMSYSLSYDNMLQYLGAWSVVLTNSITYKGYFYDQASNLYYLKSRFYNPQWRRFLNSDITIDNSNGVLGVNQFAYCCNDPVNRIDVNGEASVAITAGGIALSAVAILAVTATMMYLVDPNIKSAVNSAIYFLLLSAPSASVTIAKSLAKCISAARSKPNTKKTEKHHIVAKTAAKAATAREYLKRVGIDINHAVNLVTLNYNYHKHIHTNEYYNGVNNFVKTGYERVSNHKAGVFAALLIMNAILRITNSMFF